MPVETCFDLLGVGAGPANLAVAVAWNELAGGHRPQALLDCAPALSWHSGMQLDNSKLQVSALKDLVVQRNPCNPFSFLNYLHVKGRLKDYINLGQRPPARTEFEDYLRWVHEELGVTRFGTTVRSVDLHGDHFIVDVTGPDGAAQQLRSRSLSLAIGMLPRLPIGVPTNHPHVHHSSRAANALRTVYTNRTASDHFLVVGGGQSAGEILRHILTNYPNATVSCVAKRYLYRAVDANPIVNRLYTDLGAADFVEYSEEQRNRIWTDLRATNYGVVDEDVIADVAQLMYEDKVAGRQRVTLHPYHEVVSIEESAGRNICLLRNVLTGQTRDLRFDGALFATGYTQPNYRKLLEPIEQRLVFSDSKLVAVDRNHRAQFSDDSTTPLYIHGTSMQTHGPAEGTLTNLAEKSGRIVRGILGTLTNSPDIGIQNENHRLHSVVAR